ncbi:MAG: hypothetical protein JRE10_11080 [Deltaproteobacteria bacterium]|nr:hypothetical protein [Deltaproteobacteria bacterium]
MKNLIKTFGSMINIRQILIGATVLLVGTLVYLVDRPPDQTYFVYISPFNISLFKTPPSLFGLIGNSLPSLIHVFSFILITAGFLSCQKKCCIFELGQKFKPWSSTIVPDWFSGKVFLENSKNYFLCGTFDYFDLAAITMGTVIAFFVLLFTNKGERRVMP